MSLSTIENMGYVDYFLIVWDFIRYAKDHGYRCGTGTWIVRREASYPTVWRSQISTRSDTSFCLSVS
ncbi:MAG: hypothetical protein ACLTS6_05115 [Anaerobutyricum sp.]